MSEVKYTIQVDENKYKFASVDEVVEFLECSRNKWSIVFDKLHGEEYNTGNGDIFEYIDVMDIAEYQAGFFATAVTQVKEYKYRETGAVQFIVNRAINAINQKGQIVHPDSNLGRKFIQIVNRGEIKQASNLVKDIKTPSPNSDEKFIIGTPNIEQWEEHDFQSYSEREVLRVIIRHQNLLKDEIKVVNSSISEISDRRIAEAVLDVADENFIDGVKIKMDEVIRDARECIVNYENSVKAVSRHVERLDFQAKKDRGEHQFAMRKMEEAFRNDIALKAPAKLWEEKAETHRKTARRALVMSIALTVLLASAVVAGFFNFFGVGLTTPVPDLVLYVLLITPVACGFLLIRFFTKIYNLNQALSDDGRQRSAMARAYISLMAEENIVMSETDKSIVLNALFRSPDFSGVPDAGQVSHPIEVLLNRVSGTGKSGGK